MQVHFIIILNMITIKKFVFIDFQVNSFVLYDETGQSVLVDPGCGSVDEMNVLVSFIEVKKLQPGKIICTHGHIDHILGTGPLATQYSVPVCIHRADLPFFERSLEQAEMFGLTLIAKPRADNFLDDEELISFGNSQLKVIHLPGHSPGGVGFYCREQDFIITGDVLFRGSIGRTDLPGGSYKTLLDSIHSKLMVLPDTTVVHCGHGPETTIGDERSTNPFLL